MDIKVRERKDMFIVQYDELNDDLIKKLFIKKYSQIIYILTESNLYGIITEGDYRRYKTKRQDNLIKTKFICFTEGEKAQAYNLINDKTNNIKSIPIIDENGYILYELYSEENLYDNWERMVSDNKIKLENIYWLLQVFSIYGITRILLAEDEKNRERLQPYISLFSEHNLVLETISYDCIIQKLEVIDKDNTIVLDSDYNISGSENRCNYLQTYKVQSINLWKFLIATNYASLKDNYIYTIKMIEKFYKEAIIIRNGTSVQYIHDLEEHLEKKTIILNGTKELKWDDDDWCFSYYSEQAMASEIAVAFNFFLTQPYLKINREKVFLFSLHALYSKGFMGQNTWNFDIIHNILPHLRQYNVRPILIADPDYEAPVWRNIELSKRLRKPYIFRVDTNNVDSGIKREILDFIQYEDINLIKEFSDIPITIRKGYPLKENHSGKYFNILNGIRYTSRQSNLNIDNKIYIIGPCIFFGQFTRDEDTIASFLQTMVRDRYNIINMGIPASNWDNFRIRSQQYNPGDIIFIMVDSLELYEKAGIKVHSLISTYNRIPELYKQIWDTRKHCNRVVNKYIAEELYKILMEEEVMEDNFKEGTCLFGEKETTQFVCPIDYPELNTWKNSLDKFDTAATSIVGSIVMNCNPFTLGHRYLIEYASKQVDYLYIFIVEENKSYFNFQDRIELVKRGIEDLENVRVLPSGSYIISAVTLPGYFEKDNLQDVRLDASLDLELYATMIAPYLNIKVRFAGEEPLDKFTCQYNEAMKEILPKYGIKFVEIGRKLIDGAPISASRVRRKLEEGDFESIKKLVPPRTYDYLITRFQSE